MANKIQFRRDLASFWVFNNPILLNGELGLELDTNKFKIGNGYQDWSSLEYISDLDDFISSLEEYSDISISNILGTPPETLDTLEEIAQAINEDPDFYNFINSLISSASAYSLQESNFYTDSQVDYVEGVISSASAQSVIDSNLYTDQEIPSAIVTASAAAVLESQDYTDQELEDYLLKVSASVIYLTKEELSNSNYLPDFAGNERKILSTNGNTPIWKEVKTNVKEITNDNYSLVYGDNNYIIEMNSSGSNILTIPTNSTAAFEIGTSVDVVQTGAGQTTISSETEEIFPATTWTTVNSNFGNTTIRSIDFGNNLWVAGGYRGQIRTSTDATIWTTVNSNFGNTVIFSIAYGNDLWVAGGLSGQMRTSTNGSTWTTVTSNLGGTVILSIAYGNNLWVAGGYNGQMRTSTNGSTWTTVTSNFGTTRIISIAFGNNLWVAGGYTGQMRTSTNATTWTTVTSNFGNTDIKSIAYGNNLWVAGGYTGQMRTSTNGSTWTTVTSNFGNTTIQSIAFDNDLWVAGGSTGQMRTSSGITIDNTLVTINSKDSNNKISAQYGAATLYKRGTDEWVLIGDIE